MSSPRSVPAVTRQAEQADGVQQKRRHTRISIRWKLIIYLAGFVGLLISILWIFQIVFLGDVYRSIKVKEVQSAAETVRREVRDGMVGAAAFENMISSLSASNQMCIDVLDVHGASVLSGKQSTCYSRTDSDGCFVHETYANPFVDSFYYLLRLDFLNRIRQSGEVYFNDSSVSDSRPDSTGLPDAKKPVQAAEDRPSVMLYVEYLESSYGNFYIVLNTKVTPVSATISTLRIELYIISAVFIIAAVVMALILSRTVSSPIIEINRAAGQLATGDYSTVFRGDGYREIAELRDTLNYAATELSKVEGFRRELLANISHDLRTPLTMITGYAEVMRDLPDENTPENVQVIIDEANRLTLLVNDLLDLSKLQSGTASLSLSVFSLTDCIRSINARYGKLKESDGYVIDFLYDREVFVCADYSKLQQVIYNLVNNAVSYTGDDKRVTISQQVMQTDSGARVRISVSDTGMGISKENLDYIWDRYFKENKTHRRAVVGTGLGLSIVKGVLRMHHANFGVDTSEDPVTHGSTFWFELETASEEKEPS